MSEKSVTAHSAKKSSVLVELFDVFFILILCFATLLTTMLMRGKVLVGSGGSGGFEYHFSLPFFILTFGALGIYLLYVLPQSNRELRSMIKKIYKV